MNPSTGGAPMSGPLVLVLDPSAPLRQLYRDLLEDEGYRVSDAARLPDAGEVERLRPDALIVDHLLGGAADVVAMLHRVRVDPATSTIPVIVATAAAHVASVHDASFKDLGVQLLLKPFDIDDLLARVRGETSGQHAPPWPETAQPVDLSAGAARPVTGAETPPSP